MPNLKSTLTVSQAVVLVGGKGTRLGALTAEIPKPLLPIEGDRRFLDYLLERIAAQGVTHILLVAGHLGEQVATRYDGTLIGDCKVSVVVEPTPSGTGGALRHAETQLDDTFLMLNGDSLFDFDFRALTNALSGTDMGALALRAVQDGRRYGTVESKDGHVVAFTEKNADRVGPALISGGVYVLRRQVLERVKALPCSIESEVFPSLATQGLLACREFDGYFIDIGLPETLDQARHELPAMFGGLSERVGSI